MTKQMLFSEEACEIISTFACCSATTSNALATMPGMPCMPGAADRDEADAANRRHRLHAARRRVALPR